MPNRYMVFHGAAFYPSGGADDLLSTHAMEEEALNAVSGIDCEYAWWHIYDSWTGKIIHCSKGRRISKSETQQEQLVVKAGTYWTPSLDDLRLKGD